MASDTKIHCWNGDSDVAGMVHTVCTRGTQRQNARPSDEWGSVPEKRRCRDCDRMLSRTGGVAPVDMRPDEKWVPPPERVVDPERVVWGDLPARTRLLATRQSGGERRRVYGSVEQAAQVVAIVEADGYASGSASQSVERVGLTGTRVQTSGRGSSKTSRRAEEVATLQLAIATALQGADLPEGVTPALAWRVYRDRRVGVVLRTQEWEGRSREERTHLASDDSPTVARRYGLAVRTVDLVAMESRRAILFELAVRELVRVPQSMRGRAEAERERRAREGRTG